MYALISKVHSGKKITFTYFSRQTANNNDSVSKIKIKCNAYGKQGKEYTFTYVTKQVIQDGTVKMLN